MPKRFAVRRYHRVLRRILLLLVVLIVYGSLYPWHFAPAHLTASPLRILLHAWTLPPFPYLVRDTIVNVVLYMPLGFAAHLVFRRSSLPGIGIYGPVLLGAMLSGAMELMQLLVPSRTTSMADWITNVIGSGLGAMAGLCFEALTSRHGFRNRTSNSGVADRGALMLAFCWILWLFFPIFPVMSRPTLFRKLAIFEHAQLLDPAPLVSGAAAWFAAGWLLTAAGLRKSRVWLLLTLLAVPAQFFIVERQPLPSFLLGAVAGAVLFAVYRRTAIPAKTEAWAFLAATAVRGLSPFHFVAQSTEFNWIPFAPMLEGDWQSLAGVLIEKVFYYGTAIWLMRAAGLTPVRSVIVVALVLASIEMAQIHVPGRTPEITDPVLAILLGFVLAIL